MAYTTPVHYALNPAANPKTVSLMLNPRARQQIVIPGIYSLEGDTLKVCVPFLDVDIWHVDPRNWNPLRFNFLQRPRHLETKPRDGQFLMVFQRKKRP